MNVGPHHRCVHAHLTALHNATLLRHADQALMNLLDDLAAQRLRNTRQRFRIRHLLQTNTRELAIAQIQSHFLLQPVETPVAHVLQQQQSQHYLGRRLPPTQPCAMFVAPPLRCEDRLDQLLIFQQSIRLHHPRFP